MGYIDRKNYQRKMVDRWMNHVDKNYITTIPSYFEQWIKFDNYIKNRPPLLTTNDNEIYKTDMIFKQIKNTQQCKAQQCKAQQCKVFK